VLTLLWNQVLTLDWNGVLTLPWYEVLTFTGISIYHKTTIKPLYRCQIDGNIDVDRQLVDEFIEKIFNYLDEKKYKKDNSDPKIYYQVPNVEEVNNGLKASMKFTWETEDHRFIGENIHYRVIKISYENKDKENLAKLKSENSYLRQQLDSPIEYEDLPF